MRIGLFAAVAVLMAGAAPLWAQSTEQTIINAVVDNGCELSREEARRELRGTGITPQDARAVARDLVSQGRGRIDNGTFIYTDGPCASGAPKKAPAQEDSAQKAVSEPEAEEASESMAVELEPENRIDDMVALIRANDCEMAAAEAEVVFKAARLTYFEVSRYMLALVEDERASFDGKTVELSPELCEAAN